LRELIKKLWVKRNRFMHLETINTGKRKETALKQRRNGFKGNVETTHRKLWGGDSKSNTKCNLIRMFLGNDKQETEQN